MSKGKPWDARRTAKMAAFGLCLHGPIGHYWYGFLDRSIMANAPTSAAAVFSKTAIDQILWAPIFTSVFFGSMKVMDGKADEIAGEVSEKLWPTMKVNCTCSTHVRLRNLRFAEWAR
jgi:protein Mpv17